MAVVNMTVTQLSVRPTAKMKQLWMCLFVVFVAQISSVTCAYNIENGGIITEDTLVNKYGSPYRINNDILVAKGATLTIQEGVEMQFAPQVMLAVNGTLIAKGTPDEHILMTKDPGLGGSSPEWPEDIRLVDERSVTYGRLQLLYNGKWRGVCANYQNWTIEDTTVACQQLGFSWGNFSFISYARNDTAFMLYHRPECTGIENHIMNCPGASTIKIGTDICVQQKTIHLHCYGLSRNNPSSHNWWGLEIYNATSVTESPSDGRNVRIEETASKLEYVDIMYAGLDKVGEPVPAIRASPHAPHLIHVTIMHSALDGTNFTQIKGSTVLQDALIRNNRGHGVVVETHMGRVNIMDSNLSYNKGNGLRHKSLDGHFPVMDSENTFCRRSIIGGVQTFPQQIIGIPDWETSGPCMLKFETYRHEKITLNILEMDIELDPGRVNEGMLIVYDGPDQTGKLIGEYEIQNGTLPQSITSLTHQMAVFFSWERAVHCEILSYCIKFTILVDAGPTVVPELFVSRSEIGNNTQHGMYVENVRNYAFINETYVSHNEYGAGLTVYGGAGDVHVNASSFMYNRDNAVNVTHDGGMRIFNQSIFSHNYGNGINITINETSVNNKTRYARHQKTEVFYSEFVKNEGLGVRVSNSCSAGLVVVNESSFIQNQGDGVDYESCFKVIPQGNMTNFTVGYNTFVANYGHAIKASPLLNTYGRIGNNTFEDHPRHSLLIDNTDDFLMNRLYTLLRVDYTVSGNEFRDNHGFYVANLRLTQGSDLQKLHVYQNTFTSNVVEGRMSTLNERTRAHAVVIVSSSNVNFTCNIIINPGSEFELATHLKDQSVQLLLPRQWWGTQEYMEMAFRIFEQDSRYNLARIDYYPAMRNQYIEECGDWDLSEDKPVEIEFDRGDTLGGKLGRKFETTPGKKYFVDRDINVLPDGEFIVKDGTHLEFENAIGMLIQGKFESRGSLNQQVVYTLKNETTYTNHSHARIVDGPNQLEGRLEVRPSEDDEWGTVCEQGWDIHDAAVSCQMLGLVVHPDDWKVFENIPGSSDQPIWRSSVQCTDLDIDVTQCKADGVNDHSCNHTQDVYLRCKYPTWGGTRFLATAQKGHMSYTKLEKAGLLDPASIVYAPGIQIDYNVHKLDNLVVTNNMVTGIEILHNDVYADSRLDHSEISHNLGNGITTRGSFFEVSFSNLHHNRLAGFEYNPSLTTYELQQFRAGINNPLYVEDLHGTTFRIREDDYEFLCTKEGSQVHTTTYEVEITVDSNYFVVMDYLDYNPDITQELVTIFDSGRNSIGEFTHRWVIEDDLVDFPIVSSGSYLTLRWQVLGVSSGRLTFVARSRHFSWRWPFAEIRVLNTTTSDNDHGIVTRHYNQPSNEWLDLFYRFRWEALEMFGVDFKSNRMEAMHVPSITKYHELYMPTFEELQEPTKIAEITYVIEACHFIDNGGGVAAEHNHIEFSNNVWIWEVTHDHFEHNKGGGFTIELPKVNLMYQELYNHSVDINDTIFANNDLFEFRIDGFYCNSSIARNTFDGNVCKKDCIVISGTEKDFDMHDNQITRNTGERIVDFYITSHTPYTRWVDATVSYNNLKQNTKPSNLGDAAPSSSPDTYTFGVRGLQNVTINRNLFSNSLDFELVGGQESSILENYLDVTENWWGSYDQVHIQRVIFDFDDWNNFAIAEYYPYLIGDGFEAELATGGKLEPEMDLSQPIGGRIETNMVFTRQYSPYTVKADLTVMPGYSLVIEPGVEIKFMPHVGILVLGSMTAKGNEVDKVQFNPLPKVSSRKKRSGDTDHFNKEFKYFESADEVRLNGGDSPDEGFLEIYNSTERRWTLLCDESFNDRTAEVACKTMNKEHSNVIVRRTHLYDYYVLGYPKMHEQVIEWFWRRTFICDGTEEHLDQCRYKTNYNLYTCMELRDYIFVRCGERNLAEDYEYWGNIRFSTPEYEHGNIGPGYSILEHVDIFGAGILHGEKAGAVVAVHRTPSTELVRITNCASNGYDYIAPRDEFEVLTNHIENNNGYGVGGLILNGESQYEDPLSSFVPLVESTIPYNVYGLVRMCTTEKLIYLENRMLLYYKYRFETIDCIKIIRSREPKRQIALRFLQVNLYNDTFYKNAIEMYNYEYFEPEHLIGEINTNSSETDKRHMFQTDIPSEVDTMGIRVTASAAHGEYGFIAEVVVTPYTIDWRPELGPGHKQRIANSDLSGNQGGGFKFQNAGELNPSVIVESNRIQDGGVKILNLTGPHIVDMFIQNSRLLTIANNYIAKNKGGILVNATTNSITTAVYANITNNVIMHNTHGSSMHMEGHHYQGFDIRYNYIAHNDIEYRNVLGMFGINLNFTGNHIYRNTGETILNCSVPEKISISQRFMQNSFYDNWAFAANRTTTFLKTAKHQFTDNYLVNRRNIYEMVTYNRTKYDDIGGVYPDVDAAMNWWGSGNPSFISGRIWDRKDDENLINVNFEPYHSSNETLMQGKCHPGWRLYDKQCYLYMGGVVSYEEADQICRGDGKVLALAYDRSVERFLGEMVLSRQANYDQYWRVWVNHDYQRDGKCTVLRDYSIEHYDCNAILPFICEHDPYVEPGMSYGTKVAIIVACSVVGGIFLIVLILLCFAWLKSRTRKEQRMERKNSLRASLRGSKASIYTNRTGVSTDDLSHTKRRRPPMQSAYMDPGIVDLSGVTMEASSTDSIDKIKLDSHRPSTPASMLDQSTYSHSQFKMPPDNSSYYDSDLGPVTDSRYLPPLRLENEIPNIPARPAYPSYLSVHKNAMYDDQSLDRSLMQADARSVSSLNSPKRFQNFSYSPGSETGGAAAYPYPSYPAGGRSYRNGGQTDSTLNSSSVSASSGAIHKKPPRPKPKETAM